MIFYLNVDIFDEPHTSVRDIETLADSIQDELDNLILRTEDLSLHLVLEQRQFIAQSDLTDAQMINLRFVRPDILYLRSEKMAKTTAEKIMLGCGVVSVGGYPLGLTRGGSTFAVEREIRSIEADCDRGPVKGRVMIDTEVPKLTVNALEPFATDEIARYWPGLSLDSLNAAYDVVTGTLTIAAGDYNDISFVGKTKDGQAVTIEIDDAINLANIEWGA